ncbi:MAG: 50S ribosomal protein L28 [Chlamydiae bacterium RIFCSPHIGHO2_12_FULL_27_8]|nr:MAG: 50S ribosomal protein L28 [Chlamydiae bacterium RIFCSPHIGHO2_12_FULL_27_8]OGN65200.1 MAG: 50S ribosomal protein L28 [Chlamydiae bacterium RIFCSPLOWO2_01_FULL_28_7]
MTRKCQVTGKIPFLKGRSYALRGIAKKNKGIGLNITGKTKRKFLPNLFKKRFWFNDENRFITIKLSAQGMKIIDKKGLPQVVKEMRSQGMKI